MKGVIPLRATKAGIIWCRFFHLNRPSPIAHAKLCYRKWENDPDLYGTKIRNGIMLFFVKTDPL